MITQKELKELLHYDPLTGVFTWINPTSVRVSKGDVAGCNKENQALVIRLNNKLYRSHRLAYIYMGHEIPKLIDHKNRNPLDNRWENLRSATKSQNAMNVGLSKWNTSGHKGVSLTKSNTWHSYISVNGKRIQLGYHNCITSAIIARKKAEDKYFGEFKQ